MAYLDAFGFKVFRLRESKQEEEYVLLEKDTGKFNQYSHKRLISFLKDEFDKRGYNFNLIFRDVLKIDKPRKDNAELYLLLNWVESECILVDNIAYKPTSQLIIKDEDKEFFNIYQKSYFLKYFEISKKNKFPTLRKVLLNLVNNDIDGLKWFLHRIAFILQNPTKRLPTGIIFQGEPGSGKNLLCNFIFHKIFGSNFNEINQTQLNSEFNDWAMGKQLIVGNEVIHNDNKYLIPDKLKSYVADEYIQIRRMHRSPVLVRNYATYIFNSNNMIPLKLERNDRRYTVFKSKSLGKKKGFELYKELEKNSEKELTNFVSYLQSLNLDEEFIAAPYDNEARRDLIRFNQNSVEEFVSFSNEQGGFEKLNSYYDRLDSEEGFVSSSTFLTTIKKTDGIYVETKELYNLYLRFCRDFGYAKPHIRKSFTTSLKFMNYDNKLIKFDNKVFRAIKIQEVQNGK